MGLKLDLYPATWLVAAIACATSTLAAPLTTAPDGAPANGPSAEPRVSPDGRYIAYHSAASNLTPLDTQGEVNVYVHDRVLGYTTIASIGVNPGSSPIGDGPSMCADVSDDGRYVVFQSEATNLVAGDSEGSSDVFLHDRWAGNLERVTAGLSGDSGRPRISGDGRHIAFHTAAPIDPADTNGALDVYRYDSQTGGFHWISSRTGGIPANGHSRNPVISRDGMMIAFESDATDLVPSDSNGESDVFVYDGASNRLKLVSASQTAQDVSGIGVPASGTARGISAAPAISNDGQWVAFASDAPDLVPDDRNGNGDIFVCNLTSGSIELVSFSFFGAQGNAGSWRPDISVDGRFVGFESDASNLTPGDDNGIRDAFMVDRQTGQIGRISAEVDGEMESASGFGMVSMNLGSASDPPVFNELPGDFGDINPGDDDDGMIIPGACNVPPNCRIAGADGAPATMFSVDPGEELRFTVTGRTTCLGRALLLEIRSGFELPPGAVQNPALPLAGPVGGRVTSEFAWTPGMDDIGVYSIRYMVTDNLGRIGTCLITIQVGSCDDPPICDVDYNGPMMVEAGTPVEFSFTAEASCDGLPVLIEADALPMGAVTIPALPFTSDGDGPVVVDVQWTPQIGDVGQQADFEFSVTDPFLQTSECGLTLDIIAPSCDADPVCDISGPDTIMASPGDTITFDVTGSTICAQFGLTLEAITIPDGATLAPQPPIGSDPGDDVVTSFSWTPTADDVGGFDASFRITDDLGRETICSVTIEIGPCPEPPVCDSPDGDTFIVFMNETVRFPIIGTSDCAGAILTLDSNNLPAGATVLEGLPLVGDPGEDVVGTFEWTPEVDGVFNIDFTVTDQTGQSSACSFEVSVVDCDLLPVLTIVPDEPFLVAPGDLVTFGVTGTTECPKTGLQLGFENVPDGAQIIPDPTLISGPDEDVGALLEWVPTFDDIGRDFTVDITLTDTFERSVNDQVQISVSLVCFEFEDNNTPEDANIIDADCVYFSGKLQKNPIVDCEPDTFLTLFNKSNAVINRDDNGSDAGNGWASGLTDLGVRNNGAPKPFGDGGDGLIANGDGTFSLRLGITGRPDGLDGVFNGLFMNSGHGQLGTFRVTVTFKTINGAPITPVGIPATAPLENPVVYEDEFVTGAEAFYINYTAPLGTALVDVQIDNVVESETVCNDVDFFVIRGLIPLCDYCITQVGGIDCECRPTDLNLGWFDKQGSLIDTDDNSGPVEGYAELCIVADANGRAIIGVTGTGDNDFDGLADGWEDSSARAPSECPEPPHGHGVCGCYTLCIMVSGPHGSEAQSTLIEGATRGDLNGDGRVDAADLAQLLGFMQAH